MRLENPWILEPFFKASKVLEILLHSFWSLKVPEFWSKNIFKPQKNFGKYQFETNRVKSALIKWKSGIDLQMSFLKKRLPLRAKAHYYRIIFIVYLERVESPWKSLKSPWILYGRKWTLQFSTERLYYYFLPLWTDTRAQNWNSLVSNATKIWVLATTF